MNRKWTHALLREALELKETKSLTEIAEHFNISRQLAHQWLKRAEVFNDAWGKAKDTSMGITNTGGH